MGVQIHWKDGLPDDPLERSQIEQILVTSGLTSKYSAIKRLRDGSDEEAVAELERIAIEEGLEAAREAALAAEGVELEEEDEEGESSSSKRAEAAAKQQVGWNSNNAGRHSLRPKIGG